MNILLVCAAGMSTSIMVSKMKTALGEDQKDWLIEAHPLDSLKGYIDKFDVILLGPQVSFKYKKTLETYSGYGKPIALISPQEYGTFDGKVILDKAISLYEENKKG